MGGSRKENNRFFSTDTERDIHERYQMLMNTVGDGIYQLDPTGHFVAINDVIVEKTGYTREDLLGEHVSMVLDDPEIEWVERVIRDLLATEDSDRVATLELPVQTAAGTTIPCELRLSILEDEHAFRGTVGVIRDISERKKREELEPYKTIVETIPDGAYVLDEEYRFELVNDAFIEMTGYSREELLGSSVEMVSTEQGHERAQQLREDLRLGESDVAILEEKVQTADGETIDAEIRFAPLHDEYGSFRGTAGVVRDITERKKREETLREAKAQLEAATEAGAIGTWEWRIPEDTMITGESFAKTFGVDPEVAREGVSLDRFVDAIHPEDRDRIEREIEEAIDSCGEYETEYRVRNADDELRWVFARGYVECDDEGNPVRFPGALVDLTDRVRQKKRLQEREQQVREQREQLAALNRLNTAIRDISLTAAAATSREEIEERICERLITTDPYLFAWVGSVDRGQATVTPNAAAGAEDGYLDEIEITIDDAPTGQGPTARAIKTGEPQFTQDILNDPDYGPWREQARERGYRSSAAFPLKHNDVTYGVLNVYAEEPYAFDGPEGEMLAELAELVGHAIAAVEQRKALASGTIMELEFRLASPDDPLLEAVADHDAEVTFKRRIPVDENTYVQFIAVRGMSAATFESLLAERATVTDAKCIDESGEELLFKVTTESPPITETVTTYGGRIKEATITGGAFRVIAEFPTDVNVRDVLEALKERYPDTELLAQRTTARSGMSQQEFAAIITDRLTEKQRQALEAAYHAGYFEWPRVSTGEEVADLLDLSPATLAEHLRTAQRKLFATVFEDDTPESPATHH